MPSNGVPKSDIAEGPFWFLMIVLFDGRSAGLRDVLEQSLIDLDRDTGKALHIAGLLT